VAFGLAARGEPAVALAQLLVLAGVAGPVNQWAAVRLHRLAAQLAAAQHLEHRRISLITLTGIFTRNATKRLGASSGLTERVAQEAPDP
jgi:hypothetical protein